MATVSSTIRARGARSDVAGFSLLELLLVLFISSILLAIAVPNFREAFATSRADAIVHTQWQRLRLARTQAMVMNQKVSFDWQGLSWWIETENGHAFRHGQLDSGVRLKWRGSASMKQRIRYNENGFALGSGSLYVYEKKACLGRLVINRIGRIRLTDC